MMEYKVRAASLGGFAKHDTFRRTMVDRIVPLLPTTFDEAETIACYDEVIRKLNEMGCTTSRGRPWDRSKLDGYYTHALNVVFFSNPKAITEENEMSEDKARKVVPSFKQKIEFADLLRQHCSLVDGMAVYNDGWSDEAILNEFQRIVTPEIDKHTNKPKVYTLASVAGMRKELLGDLRAISGEPKSRDYAIERLQTQINKLLKTSEEQETRIAELEATCMLLMEASHTHSSTDKSVKPTPKKGEPGFTHP